MSVTLYAKVDNPQAQSTNYLVDTTTLQDVVIPADMFLKYVVINKAASALTAGKNIVLRLENDVDLIKQSDGVDTTMINSSGVKSTLSVIKRQLTANRKVILDVSGDVSGTFDISIKYEPF